MKVKIDLTPFFENSSSADILGEFCSGGSLAQLEREIKKTLQ